MGLTSPDTIKLSVYRFSVLLVWPDNSVMTASALASRGGGGDVNAIVNNGGELPEQIVRPTLDHGSLYPW